MAMVTATVSARHTHGAWHGREHGQNMAKDMDVCTSSAMRRAASPRVARPTVQSLTALPTMYQGGKPAAVEAAGTIWGPMAMAAVLASSMGGTAAMDILMRGKAAQSDQTEQMRAWTSQTCHTKSTWLPSRGDRRWVQAVASVGTEGGWSPWAFSCSVLAPLAYRLPWPRRKPRAALACLTEEFGTFRAAERRMPSSPFPFPFCRSCHSASPEPRAI
jgi:hypothetical protein